MASLPELGELHLPLRRSREPDNDSITRGDTKRVKIELQSLKDCKAKDKLSGPKDSLSSTRSPANTSPLAQQPSTAVRNNPINLSRKTEATTTRVLTFLHVWARKRGVSVERLKIGEISNAIQEISRDRGWQNFSRKNARWFGWQIHTQQNPTRGSTTSSADHSSCVPLNQKANVLKLLDLAKTKDLRRAMTRLIDELSKNAGS